jgi:hypothetical protein
LKLLLKKIRKYLNKTSLQKSIRLGFGGYLAKSYEREKLPISRSGCPFKSEPD